MYICVCVDTVKQPGSAWPYPAPHPAPAHSPTPQPCPHLSPLSPPAPPCPPHPTPAHPHPISAHPCPPTPLFQYSANLAKAFLSLLGSVSPTTASPEGACEGLSWIKTPDPLATPPLSHPAPYPSLSVLFSVPYFGASPCLFPLFSASYLSNTLSFAHLYPPSLPCP